MTTLKEFDIDSLRKELAATELDRQDWDACSSRIRDFAEAALNESRMALADYAHSLTEIIELVELSQDETFKSQLIAFVVEQLDFLDPDADSDTIQQATQQTKEKRQEYLDCFDQDQGSLDDGDWDTDDLTAVGEFENSDDHNNPSPDQLELLLSAVSKQTDLETHTIEPPSPRPSKQNEPQATRPTADTNDPPAVIEDNDLREAFMDDASRGLNAMEQSSLAFEQNPQDREAVTQFGRELHTLKGASGSVGLSQLASEIHAAESELAKELSSEQTVDLMLQTVDKVRDVIQQVSSGAGDNADPTGQPSGSRDVLDTVSYSAGSGEDSLIRIRASKLDRLMDMLAELVVLRNRRESHISELNEFNEELRLCADRLSYFAEDPSRSENNAFNSSLTLSELSKDINDLSSGIRHLQRPVNKDNVSISHFIRDFRHELMQLRRIPIAGLFNRVQRSARDAAKTEGKKLRFEIQGDDAGLERELQEKLFEPLLHIVRNAVSHGIESPDERRSRGKDPSGLVALEAQSNSQMVVITIGDDGGGLNYEAIRQRGLEKGLIKPNQFLNESELGKLIFHPGFSTRDAASEVSGRGVGMDVVMTTIQQMRGRIEIESTAGRGTTMTLSIPVRAGIEHVMVFRSGGQLFALPMQAVSKVSPFNLQNENIVPLSSVLGIQAPGTGSGKDVLMLRNHERNRNARKFGFLVEEILGPEEVVIRKLPNLLQSHPLFSGLTLSGAGESALLLDADRLAKFNRNINAVPTGLENVDEENESKRLLVVDDSMSARKLLSKKLLSYGFTVVEAADGIEGLEQIRNGQFDLVFTDLDMPRMGGLELLFDLQQGRHKDQKVVVVSSRSVDEFRERAMELGAIDYLAKPVEDHHLKQLLEQQQLVL